MGRNGSPWFKKLFNGLRDPEEAKDESQEVEQPQEAKPVVPTQSSPQVEDVMQLDMDGGAMLRVWQQWKGEGTVPPPLSLVGRSHPVESLPLNGGSQAISREKLRLKTQLEKDARDRFRQIEQCGPDQSLDAECRIYLSRFGMVAWAFLFPPVGEAGKLRMDIIGKALQASGVTSGIDSGVVLRLAQEKAYYDLIPIALGTAPVEGEDGRVEEHYPREFQKAIKVDEDGKADYRSLAYVQLIKKDDVICDIIPPKEGQPGLRVDGQIVEAKKVRPARAPAGSNTELSEDGAHLVAAIDGHLVYSNGTFMVRPLLDIPGNVDYSTGNIDYRGDVHVHGDVRENFFVRATGTVTIDGTVEAANVEAGGDLIVSCGVLGDNRATIKSEGCVRAKYLESCVAYAGKGVYADCIMAAQIYSDDEISVTTGRGTVIGGTLTAARKINAHMIGSQSNMRTSLVLGVLPYSQEKLRNDEADLKTVRHEIKELNKTLDLMESQQGLAGMDEKLAKARLRKSVLSMKEDKLLKFQSSHQAVVPDLTKCRVECDTMYPGTSLKIQEDVWRAEDVCQNCKLGYDEETASIKEI
jgi:hypothetical protein